MSRSNYSTHHPRLDSLQEKLRAIFDSRNEQILHFPIKGLKIKPKGKLCFLKNQSRYLLLTSSKLYTLDPESLDKGIVDRNKLLINNIDMEYFSHIILFFEYRLDIKDLLENNIELL